MHGEKEIVLCYWQEMNFAQKLLRLPIPNYPDPSWGDASAIHLLKCSLCQQIRGKRT